MSRTYGSYMLQPTKDEIRHWLSETRSELKQEKLLRRVAEYRLGVATRTLGRLVLEGKLIVPLEKLGRAALEVAIAEETERETEKALAES